MSPETLLLSVCLALAFGGVPLATLIHARTATMRAVRHVAEIEALAASRAGPEELHAAGVECLDVRELQALAMAAAEELKGRSDGRARGEFGPHGDRLRHRWSSRSRPLAKAG